MRLGWLNGSKGVVFAFLVLASPLSCGGVRVAGAGAVPEKQILSTFADIDKVPRCSKDEAAISAWLNDWARAQGLQVMQDAFKNVLITVPPTPGWELQPGVILQSHMDMVCLKTAGSQHDFTRDAIPLLREGDWVRAKDTTLGADDGIGMAIALTLAEKSKSPHPKLELLFTADEERDMTGASGLGDTVLTGSRFINLDSENDSILTLGAAGGMHTDVLLPLDMTPLPDSYRLFGLKVTGLRGGHSGVDINKNRANANVLISEFLTEVGPFRLVSLDGGTVDNAIASWADATIALEHGSAATLKRRAAEFVARAKRRYGGEGPVTITLVPIRGEEQLAVSEQRSAAAVRLITSLPQGVTAWSEDFKGLPETSDNVGVVRTRDGLLEISTLQRSFHSDNLRAVSAEIRAAAQAAGGSSNSGTEFPAWPPNPSTALAKSVQAAYKKLNGSPMRVQVIHAGLECGNLAAKYPSLEMVSIGPTLMNVHSTNEALKIASVRKVWRLLEEVLRTKAP